MANVLTNQGRAILTNRIKGAGTEPVFVGWGTAAGTAAVGDTTLFTEDYSSTNDGTHNLRATGTTTQQTTSVTNDTWQNIATLTAAHATAVTNVGAFDTNGQAASLVVAPSGGNLFVKGDFSVINLATNDSLQATIKLQFT